MDSLTQIVLGAAVGEAVLGKKIGNRAMLWGAVAGTIPDLDVAARYLTDTITATEIHRGFSHSIIFAVLMAPLLGWAVHQLKRRPEVGVRGWAWLFFWGLFTHPILDAFTTWGTQLFWPLDWRLAFNSIFVIDPLYTLPFLICLLGAAFSSRATVQRKKRNWTGIYLSTGYLLLTVVLKGVAFYSITSDLKSKNITYSALSTRPAPFNTILWNANVDTEDAYLISDYSFFDTQPMTWQRFPKQRAAASTIINTSEVQRLIDVAQGWYLLEYENDHWYFNDLRFGLIPLSETESQFVFRYRLEQTQTGEIQVFEDRPDTRAMRGLFELLWDRLKGN
ncbi:MAG: metal-dependent hydrolase [Cytophagaceae bacterium]|nr:metal-dependent hydrolase [Cytophagaceae bacterium]